MRIDPGRCVSCGECVPYCPVGAIIPGVDGAPSAIDPAPCVECGVCRRVEVCPSAAIESEELTWPRSLRQLFSDPLLVHDATGVPGRGTEEMKTNDVTGRLRPGEVGVTVELGRPGVSASLREVEVVAMACAAAGAELRAGNPITALMPDPTTGRLAPEVLEERVMSALVEMVVPADGLSRLLAVVEARCARLDTVASVGVAGALSGGESALGWARRLGLPPAVAGKINVGLGRLSSASDRKGSA